jgi:hypothetical protein
MTLTRCAWVVTATLALSHGGTAVAQEAVEPTEESAPDDPPEVDAAYGRAMDAFTSGDFASAATAFDEVAGRTVETARRITATELAAEARARAAAPPPPTAGDELTTPAPPVSSEAYLETAPVPPPPPGDEDRRRREDEDEARGELLSGTTALGLGFWAWSVPYALDAEIKLAVGTYMVIGAGSFFVPFLLTQDVVVSPAAATLSLAFGVEGAWLGAMLYGLATAFDPLDRDDGRSLLPTMAAMSVAGTVGGYAWADLTEMDEGTAHAIYSGLLFAALWALAIEVLIFGDEWAEGDTRIRINMAGLLTGAGLGVLGGKLLADARTYTWGDAEVVQTTGIVGAYLGLVPLVIAEVTDPRVFGPVLAVTSAGGLFAGDLLVDGLDLTDGQAWLVNIGAYVGGLLGAGTAFLASGDDFDATDAKIMVSLSAATAIGGGALIYHLIDKEREDADPSSDAPATAFVAPTLDTDAAGALTPGVGLAGTF